MNRDTTAFFDCLSFGSHNQAIVYGDASTDAAGGARTNLRFSQPCSLLARGGGIAHA